MENNGLVSKVLDNNHFHVAFCKMGEGEGGAIRIGMDVQETGNFVPSSAMHASYDSICSAIRDRGRRRGDLFGLGAGQRPFVFFFLVQSKKKKALPTRIIGLAVLLLSLSRNEKRKSVEPPLIKHGGTSCASAPV
jgi:hypothetical protein